MKVDINTVVNPGEETITQKVVFLNPELDQQFHSLCDQIIELKHQHIKEALIKLGWTPPSEKRFCEWKRKGPADYGMIEYTMSCGSAYIGQEGHCNAFLFCPRCGKPRKEQP